MKRFGLIIATLGLFAFSIYLAFVQGGAVISGTSNVEGTFESVQASPLIYTGFKAEVAKIFVVVMNSLMALTGKSILLSIILLGLLVELVLLYPSLRIQLKQKKSIYSTKNLWIGLTKANFL